MPVTTPTLAATPDYTNGCVSITVSTFGSATSWTLYRSGNLGDYPVRGAIGQSTTVATVVDVDFPQGEDIQYWCEVTDDVTTEFSAYTDLVAAPDLGADVLCEIGAGPNGYPVTVLSMGDATWAQRAEVVTVVDRADPVVVTDRSSLPSFTLEVLVGILRTYIVQLIESNPVILFSPRHSSWAFADSNPIYVVVTGMDESLYGGPSDGDRILRLQCQRVGTPKIPAVTTAPVSPWIYTGE